MANITYQYEFSKNDFEGIRKCNEQHGFAIVKQMLPLEIVEQLKTDVRNVLEPRFTDDKQPSQTSINFIEESPVLTSLLTYEPMMSLVRYLYDNKPITLNRTAAIYKKPGASAAVKGSGAHAWHTDWDPLEHPYRANAVLNTTGASSFWFYLTGSHPQNGGLAIIPDSHTEDWPGPEGFEFTNNRKSFHPKGNKAEPYGGMDVPGMMPVETEPGDMVVFAERTYHGVHPHNGQEPRLSCALSFRRKDHVIEQCWPLPESARRFIATCPPEAQQLVEDYIGIDTGWVSKP